MQLRDIMTRDVQTATPETTIRDAARKMRSFDIGILPVCDSSGEVVGIVTDRDIVVRACSEGLDPTLTPISECMSKDVIYCSENDDVQQAVKIMEDRQLRRILVCDDFKKPIGICSLGDLALDAGDLQLTGEVVHEVSRHGW